MRFVQELIDGVDRNLRSLESLGSGQDSGDLFAAHLRSQKQHLLTQLEKPDVLEWEDGPLEDDAEIILSGAPVDGHTIQAHFLGEVLEGFQNLLDAISQSRTSHTEARDRVQGKVVGSNQLMVAHTFEGSFGLCLRVAPNENGEPKEAKESLATVRSLLNGQEVTAEVDEVIMNAQVRRSYKTFIGLLAKNQASLNFRIEHDETGVVMSAQAAAARIQWLKNPR